jgi:hypothetical protein
MHNALLVKPLEDSQLVGSLRLYMSASYPALAAIRSIYVLSIVCKETSFLFIITHVDRKDHSFICQKRKEEENDHVVQWVSC